MATLRCAGLCGAWDDRQPAGRHPGYRALICPSADRTGLSGVAVNVAAAVPGIQVIGRRDRSLRNRTTRPGMHYRSQIAVFMPLRPKGWETRQRLGPPAGQRGRIPPTAFTHCAAAGSSRLDSACGVAFKLSQQIHCGARARGAAGAGVGGQPGSEFGAGEISGQETPGFTRRPVIGRYTLT